MFLSELSKLHKNLTLLFIIYAEWTDFWNTPSINTKENSRTMNDSILPRRRKERKNERKNERTKGRKEPKYLMGGGEITFFGTETETVRMVKWKHSPEFMGLYYIWHVEMRLWKERKFLETDPDYLCFWRYAHQRKASQGHDWSSQNKYCISFKYQEQGEIESSRIMHSKMKSPENEVSSKRKSSQILYKIFKNMNH